MRSSLRERLVDSSDRRVLRTRTKLIDSFRHLLDEFPQEPVTVTAVVRHAGVSRSSFYAHFCDVGDLAAIALTEFTEALISLARAAVDEGGSRTATNRQVGLQIAQYLADRRETFGALLVAGGRFANAITSSIATQSLATLRTRAHLHGHPDVTAQYMAGGFVHVLAWWLATGSDLTPEDLADALISITPADFVD